MIAALVVALALQADPQIEKVERLTGDVNRPLLWTPLKITLSSAAGFDGDLVVRSEFGFETAKKVQLAPGGRAAVLLPSIDPKEVVAGKSVRKVSRDFLHPDRIVLVDSRLPYAGELASTPQVLYQKISPEDLEAAGPRGLLEAADLILTGTLSKEDAEKAVAALGEPAAQMEAVDRALWPLAPVEGWVPTKKSWALFFAVLYAFAAFVALAVVARRFPKFGLACIAGVAVAGVVAAAALFPRQQMWAISDSLEDISAAPSRTFRVWFLGSPVDLESSVTFPMLVKPIFASPAGTDDPFMLRIDDRGCRVERLKLGPTHTACFGTMVPLASIKPGGGVAVSVSGAVLVRDGRASFLGNLTEGAEIPKTAEGGNPSHRSPEYDAWNRFVGRNGLFGRRVDGGMATHDLASPDLADERERPRCILQRLP
jgi:hypothetical protein